MVNLDTQITLTVRELLQYTRDIARDITKDVEALPTTHAVHPEQQVKTVDTGAVLFNRGYNRGIDEAAERVIDGLDDLRSLYEEQGYTGVVRTIRAQAAAAHR